MKARRRGEPDIMQGYCCITEVAALYAWGMRPPHLLLAIESSCDETAAAVLRDGSRLLANVIASQIAIHREYGGIVPELASRHHMTSISPVVRQALEEAGVKPSDIDAVAVTQGPGLVGSLIVGLSFAKAFAFSRNIPFVGVNHVHAHLFSIFLEDEAPSFPYVALVVSGGHTSIYLAEGFDRVRILGQTRDDAAGEAFDKVAKILGLEYPGGPVISRLAARGRPDAFLFPRAKLPDTPLDFSFSGLKTAVLTAVRKLEAEGGVPIEDICASFQEAVVDVLVEKSVAAALRTGVSDIVVAGGVAANSRLREALRQAGDREGLRVLCPGARLCTDNAAMVAIAGYHRLRMGHEDGLDADVYSRMPSFSRGKAAARVS